MRKELKKYREELGYTQQSIADELGISKATYNQLELGVRAGKIQTWLKIKNVLALTNDELVNVMQEGLEV